MVCTYRPDPADLDGDGVVGITDFLILLASWDQTDSPADIDGDGMVAPWCRYPMRAFPVWGSSERLHSPVTQRCPVPDRW